MMAVFARGWLLALAMLLLGCMASPAPSTAGGTSTSLAAALKGGKPFILVVSPANPPQAVLESEAYGDWAAALAAFQTRLPDGLTLVTASPADYQRAVRSPAIEDGFATLFVGGRGRALIHQGRILDPFLYDCGANYLRSLPTCPEAPAYGMPEVAVVRR
jgi:hypothetical protein